MSGCLHNYYLCTDCGLSPSLSSWAILENCLSSLYIPGYFSWFCVHLLSVSWLLYTDSFLVIYTERYCVSFQFTCQFWFLYNSSIFFFPNRLQILWFWLDVQFWFLGHRMNFFGSHRMMNLIACCSFQLPGTPFPLCVWFLPPSSCARVPFFILQYLLFLLLLHLCSYCTSPRMCLLCCIFFQFFCACTVGVHLFIHVSISISCSQYINSEAKGSIYILKTVTS